MARGFPLAVALGVLPVVLPAQDPLPIPAADSALAGCLAVSANTSPDRQRLVARAEALWRAEVSRSPDLSAPRVGLARVLVQCRLPLAETPDEQLTLFRDAVTELELAVQRDPAYWPAHFTLGLVFARAPTFLGHTNEAILHLEQATSEHGIPNDRGELAEALHELARLYVHVGRLADAEGARSRARELFPGDQRFRSPQQRSESTIPRGPVTVVSEITVTATSPLADESRRGRSISSLQIVTLPGGTGDLMQVLQTMPGVTGGSESSDLSLRGGDPYESPVILNGARLLYVGKFESLTGALFGVLDPNVLRVAQVHPGGFSARFGDALSGIIEADAIGRPGGKSRRLALNTAGPSATLMQPVGQMAGVWGSFRITTTDLLLRMHGRRDEYESSPVSLEGMVSAARVLRGGELQIVALGEHDLAAPELSIAGHSGAYHSRGTTLAAVLSGKLRQVGPLVALRFSVTASSRRTDTEYGVLDFSRRLQRAGLRVEGDALLGTMLLRGGLEAARISQTLEGTVPTTGSYAPGAPARTLSGTRPIANHLGAFAELLLFPAAGLTIIPGLRLDHLPGEHSWNTDPRLAVEMHAGDFTLSVAGGVFHQGSFRPTREEPALDERTGIARRARHLVLGIEHRGKASVRADLFLKHYDRWARGSAVLRPKDGSVIGGDFFVHLSGERWNGLVTYSIMQGRLTLPDGEVIPTAFDVTHSVVTMLKQRIGQAWEVGATARLATGRPFTATEGSAPVGADPEFVLGTPNGDRYPYYQRLDARLSHYARLGHGLLVSYVEVLNLTGRRNVAAYGGGEDNIDRAPITTFFSRRTIVIGAELR